MAEPKRHTVEIDVRYAETDQMGVVHHANYLVWFEYARTELCRQAGFHYADIEERGYLLMVVDARLTYRKGARYGETIHVNVWVDRLGSRLLVFAYEVTRAGELLAQRLDPPRRELLDGAPLERPQEQLPVALGTTAAQQPRDRGGDVRPDEGGLNGDRDPAGGAGLPGAAGNRRYLRPHAFPWDV